MRSRMSNSGIVMSFGLFGHLYRALELVSCKEKLVSQETITMSQDSIREGKILRGYVRLYIHFIQ